MSQFPQIHLVLAGSLLFSACASQAVSDEPEACPPGLSVYCETYLGKPQRCFCASRDDLRDVLEPVQEPY